MLNRTGTTFVSPITEMCTLGAEYNLEHCPGLVGYLLEYLPMFTKDNLSWLILNISMGYGKLPDFGYLITSLRGEVRYDIGLGIWLDYDDINSNCLRYFDNSQ